MPKPYLIANFAEDSGLVRNLEPFLIPEKAFTELENAYIWRGRVKRRLGFALLGRLRRILTNIAQDVTDGTANYADTDLLDSVRVNEPNAEIEPGTVTITIDRGNPNETIYNDSTTSGILTFVSGPFTGAGTINYLTGAVAIVFTAAPGAGVTVDANLSYFPALPCMGLRRRELSTINDEQLIAFDTRYAYRVVSNQFQELPSVAATTWSGSDSQFFWTTNYFQNANGDLFWATNFNGPGGAGNDPIRYYDGTTWTTFAPTINGANELHQCRIILPYKDRLLALNTWEGGTLATSVNFPQRLRFSQNGDPTDLANGWRDDIIGRGGFIDAPTNEHIISAEFIKDTLLVKFERSSWKLIYTGNEAFPFFFQKINTELGAESTFSLIPFDRGVFAVGNYGVTVDDSVNVQRIDEKIPDEVFKIHNASGGPERVHGIRDFRNELAYWTIPNAATNPTYPDRLLIYNYLNGTFSFFDDSFTTLGYFQYSTDRTWTEMDMSWEEAAFSWDSGVIQSLFPEVVAGNQQGFVLVLNQRTFNEPSLAIRVIAAGTPAVITSIGHNLQTGAFIRISGSLGATNFNGNVYEITRLTDDTFSINATVVGIYIGGGQITTIPRMDLRTKFFSFGFPEGKALLLSYVDFFADRTDDGEVTINLYNDENPNLALNPPGNASGLLGGNLLTTAPETDSVVLAGSQKLWHRVYLNSVSGNFQLQLTYNDAQLADIDEQAADFVLHALTLYVQPTGDLAP